MCFPHPPSPTRAPNPRHLRTLRFPRPFLVAQVFNLCRRRSRLSSASICVHLWFPSRPPLPPSNTLFVASVPWCRSQGHPGGDPIALLSRHPARLQSHLRFGPAPKPNPFAPLTAGWLAWERGE